jgi:hypothetical protein
MLFVLQIALLILWFTLFPTLAWWLAFLPALLGTAWLCYRAASLIFVILHDTRNDTHTPFFK